MMLPAVADSLPARLSVAGLPADLVEGLKKMFDETWRPLSREMRERRPEVGGATERAFLGRFMAFIAGVLNENPGVLGVLRDVLDQGLSDLLKAEFAESAVERKLALRQIGSALSTFAVSSESLLSELGPLVFEALSDLPDLNDASAMNSALADPVAAAFLRVELDLMVAVDAVGESLDDLTYWARRVATSARRLEAVRMNLPLAVRADIARVRATRSWAHWTDEDIKQELSPWRDASSSRPPTRRRSSR